MLYDIDDKKTKHRTFRLTKEQNDKIERIGIKLKTTPSAMLRNAIDNLNDQ